MIKWLWVISILLYVGCNQPKLESIDPKNGELTTIHWDANDMQEIAQKISTEILSSTTIDFSKTYSFGKIRNDSHDHIDTKLLANKISTALIQSGKVKISKNKNHQSSGIFYGKISSIFKKNSTTKDIFFNFNLYLTDIQTSRVVWNGSVSIRKIYKKALFGL